ncbi:fkbM_fam, methyltransferase, FkbM family [uncultured Caudovirales phage]|jgi:FkbM family methyltransferase|uniref:FkbM_fam, methyltransferase, FkbM family n=1 Tax=uncultured Caudovirales phage TaxID=2100421 RepID=A0A6J7XDQ1_9CAUD|nr:fkbM_fam, methyltransferase, FkbM family [uncultured Caudovirales phage]CAB5229276.1 fkbM_fam, methyltransferase, FkbM family [uncultured Caudovirales phage]
MRQHSGWAVPERDEHCIQAVLAEVSDLGASLDLCRQFRTAIQAGGNVGVYPMAMAQKFERVYTVEPDAANYEALAINTVSQPRVVIRRAAFGQDHSKAAIDQIYPDNIGAHQIKEGNEFDVLPIDSLGVTDCDLLQLDVEGSEHQAILGAIATIKASWPVITLELKGHGERYGYTDMDTINLLADMGYRIADRVNRDVIFTHG